MKILYINALHKKGSTGRICFQLMNYINKKNIDSVIAYRYYENDCNEGYPISTYFDCHVHNRIVKYTGLQGYFSRLRTLKFLKFIDNYSPDIIHIHNIYSSYINIRMLLNYIIKRKIKLIWTIHDCQIYTGGCAYYSNIQCNKWKSECKNCKLRNKNVLLNFDFTNKIFRDKIEIYSQLQQNSEKIRFVTVSNWLKNECKSSIINKFDIRTIYNGIDTDNFYIEKDIEIKNDFHNKFVILGVANIWEERKGLEYFKKLSKKLDKNLFSIVLVGLSHKQVYDLKNSEYLNIIGFERTKSISELRHFYNLADVFVNFSLEETFGLVTGEALACGTPVIVFNSTACSEIVDKSCGFILDKTIDISKVCDCINIIKKKGKNFYSENARKRIENYFSLEKMLNNYYNLYMEMSE